MTSRIPRLEREPDTSSDCCSLIEINTHPVIQELVGVVTQFADHESALEIDSSDSTALNCSSEMVFSLGACCAEQRT